MKSPNKTFTRIFLSGAVLMMTSAATAQEQVTVEPEIAICEMIPTIDFIDTELVETEVSIEDEVAIDEEIVIDEEVTDEIEIEVGEPEVSVGEGTEKEPQIITCWEPGWLYRTGGEGEFHIALQSVGTPSTNAGGSVTENVAFQSSAPIIGVANNAPQAADEASAVTTVLKNTVSTNITRVASKPTAVKSKGRVFLR